MTVNELIDLLKTNNTMGSLTPLQELILRYSGEGTLLKTMTGHQAVLTGLAFSLDGKTLASASRDKTIKLWNLDDNLTATFQGHQAGIWDVA